MQIVYCSICLDNFEQLDGFTGLILDRTKDFAACVGPMVHHLVVVDQLANLDTFLPLLTSLKCLQIYDPHNLCGYLMHLATIPTRLLDMDICIPSYTVQNFAMIRGIQSLKTMSLSIHRDNHPVLDGHVSVSNLEFPSLEDLEVNCYDWRKQTTMAVCTLVGRIQMSPSSALLSALLKIPMDQEDADCLRPFLERNQLNRLTVQFNGVAQTKLALEIMTIQHVELKEVTPALRLLEVIQGRTLVRLNKWHLDTDDWSFSQALEQAVCKEKNAALLEHRKPRLEADYSHSIFQSICFENRRM